MDHARPVAESFVERPAHAGACLLARFDDNPERAFALCMVAVATRSARSDVDAPRGLRADEHPIELLTVERFGLCVDHARQVARAYVHVMFLRSVLPTGHAPTWKSLYNLGTLTCEAPWTAYATALLIIARARNVVSADQFDTAVGGLRIFVRRLSRAFPVALFPSEGRSIARLFRSSGPSGELEVALHDVLSRAVVEYDMTAAGELVAALRKVLIDFNATVRARSRSTTGLI